MLKDAFTAQEFSEIRSLLGEISQIQREHSSERYKNERDFQTTLDNQLHLIKLPALVACVDQSSLVQGGYRRLYQLGTPGRVYRARDEKWSAILLCSICGRMSQVERC